MNPNRRSLCLIAAALLPVLAARAASPSESPVAWPLTADHAAARWDHGYPVGNGSLGGLSLGAFPKEQIFLNHDTIWSHPARHELAANVRKADMDEAFALCLKGDFAGAQGVYCRAKNKGNSIATFQGLGALEIVHLDASNAAPAAIARRLDLVAGEASALARLADGEVRETLLASYPDRCLAVRLESTRPGGLHCRLQLSRAAGLTNQFAKGNEIGFDGQAGAGGTKFAARLRVIPSEGGSIAADGNALVLNGGASATLLITAATDHHRDAPRAPRTDDWAADATRDLEKAVALGWDSLRARAAADHQALMARCVIDLGPTDPAVAARTTPERMELLKKGGSDPDLLETFFQFGRHMLIGSSRPGSLPPNLQGLWEPGLHAAWNGDFHLNINVQMNMWPANVTGLGECNEPFFALLKLIHAHGQETAASLGCRGYAAGLASDAWGQSDWVGGSPEWDSFILGGHWAQEHLMEYYRFTQDSAFLRDTAWPILKDGALFLLDWMRAQPDGTLLSGPGSSPENAYRYTTADGQTKGANISIGNTVDHAIAWETFSDVLECAALLGIQDDFTAQVAKALKQVPPPAIGEDGRIMEWWKPFGEVWKGHRHKSHLYGLYPGRQISLEGTPELAKAAEASLTMRMDPKNGDCAGGGHTGWNLAWSANLWARLQQGDRALDMLLEQLRTQVNENLFNRCGGPFQIDGNLGAPAAIAEMLVQSREEKPEMGNLKPETDRKPSEFQVSSFKSQVSLIHLLPALPRAWPSGSAKGLRARGGFVVDVEWKDGKVTHYRVTSPASREVNVRVNDETKTLRAEKE